MSSLPNFATEKEAAERQAAYDRQERMPADVEDAIAILSERGHGSVDSLRRYVAGEPGTESSLPSRERMSARNEFASLNVVVSNRKRPEPEPVKEPTYRLPDPDGDVSMSDLTRRGPLFVRQFQTKFPEAYARLEAADRRRMAGPPVR